MLCDKKHSHVQWRDFKMNVLVCDDDQQIVDSIIEELKKKSEETHVALRFYGFSQPSQKGNDLSPQQMEILHDIIKAFG